MGRVKIFILIILFTGLQCFAQTAQNIDNENRKLDKLQGEISALQGELQSLSAEEENTYSHLEKLKKEELLLNKIVNELLTEEKRVTSKISNLASRIADDKKKVEELKESYSNYIVWLYKKGGRSELSYLADASTINELYLRYKNMQYLHEAFSNVKERLDASLKDAHARKIEYESARLEQKHLIAKKNQETEVISRNKSEKESLISKLKKNQENVENEIEEKRKAQLAIKDLIAKLIRDAEQRKLTVKTTEKEQIPDFSYKGNTRLETLKGRLEWPLSKGKIVRKFGNNKNPKLKTVTVNYGIDIEASTNRRDVRVVSSGVVSAIEWIPGYGSIIIVNHNNDYRTVYGHVNEISVREGDVLTAGDIIAKVAESIEGAVLHFEVWDGRKNENPEIWLVKR